MAQVRIPLPFTPVPITGQTFAVLVVGAALGSEAGSGQPDALSAPGLAGLPFFAGGASGLAILAGPDRRLPGRLHPGSVPGRTAGGARGLDRRIPSALLAFLAGEIVIYLFGVAWLSVYLGISACAHGWSAAVPGRGCHQAGCCGARVTGRLGLGEIIHTRNHVPQTVFYLTEPPINMYRQDVLFRSRVCKSAHRKTLIVV